MKTDRCIANSTQLALERELLLADSETKVAVADISKTVLRKKKLPVPEESDTWVDNIKRAEGQDENVETLPRKTRDFSDHMPVSLFRLSRPTATSISSDYLSSL